MIVELNLPFFGMQGQILAQRLLPLCAKEPASRGSLVQNELSPSPLFPFFSVGLVLILNPPEVVIEASSCSTWLSAGLSELELVARNFGSDHGVFLVVNVKVRLKKLDALLVNFLVVVLLQLLNLGKSLRLVYEGGHLVAGPVRLGVGLPNL